MKAPRRPTLIVVAGPNGSGKTTLTEVLLGHHWLDGCIYINADNIAQREFGDWNSAAAVLNAARRADELRNEHLAKCESMAFETVFSTAGRAQFLKAASAEGYFIRLFFVGTHDPLINVRRVAQRVREGGHNVPEDKIIARYSRAMENLTAVIGMVDRAYIYDNSIDDRMPGLLFRATRGRLEKAYAKTMPAWALPAFTSVSKA